MSSSRTARYFDVLSVPHVPFTFGVALAGRTAYALVFLPLLYIVEQASGSIALAGITVALYGAGAAFLAPARAWLIDRYGASRVLRILVVAFGATLAAVAAASLLDAHGAIFLVLASVAGAVAPPLGPTMRVAWGRLMPDAEYLRKALSFDAVVEELLYLAGPAVTGLALAFFAPGVVLMVPAVLVIAGGLLFISAHVVREMPSRKTSTSDAPRLASLLSRGAFVGILVPVLVAGGVSGALSVAVPALMANHGGPAAAGVALGLFAGGSAVGGLLFGVLRVPGSAARQLVVLTGALLAISSLLAFAAGAVAVSVVLTAAGLSFSPIMIVAYVAAQVAGGEHQQSSATTWVNTSHNIGASAGSAAAGILVQWIGVSLSVLAVVGVGLALVATGGMLARRPGDRQV